MCEIQNPRTARDDRATNDLRITAGRVCRIMLKKKKYYANGHNQGIMLKIMPGWRYNAQTMPD